MNVYGEGLLAPRPTPKLENHPLSAVRDCLFNLFAATLHIGGRSSMRYPRMRHAVVTGTLLSRRFSAIHSSKCREVALSTTHTRHCAVVHFR